MTARFAGAPGCAAAKTWHCPPRQPIPAPQLSGAQRPPHPSSPQTFPAQSAAQAHLPLAVSQVRPTPQLSGAQTPPQPSGPHSFPVQAGLQVTQAPPWHFCPVLQPGPHWLPQPPEPHCLPWQDGAQAVQRPLFALQTLPEGQSPQEPWQPSSPHTRPSHSGVHCVFFTQCFSPASDARPKKPVAERAARGRAGANEAFLTLSPARAWFFNQGRPMALEDNRQLRRAREASFSTPFWLRRCRRNRSVRGSRRGPLLHCYTLLQNGPVPPLMPYPTTERFLQ